MPVEGSTPPPSGSGTGGESKRKKCPYCKKPLLLTIPQDENGSFTYTMGGDVNGILFCGNLACPGPGGDTNDG